MAGLGIILGREFPAVMRPLRVPRMGRYLGWYERARARTAIMKEAFYEIAKQASDQELTIATIIHWAREAGWVPKAIGR